MNWKLALVFLRIVPPLSIATAIYQKKLIRTQRLARKTNSKITAGFNEEIAGVRTTKAFVREEENLKEFQTLTAEMFDYSLRNSLHAAVYLPIVMSLGAAGVGLAVWRGGLLAVGGECIALIGETGSGKSTIVKVLCRFYEPTQGRILIDGVDYRNLPLHWLQSTLGMVLQEPHLFSGTIRENIRYGRLDATEAEVESVARQVGAAAFIASLPAGYGTEVGGSGKRP